MRIKGNFSFGLGTTQSQDDKQKKDAKPKKESKKGKDKNRIKKEENESELIKSEQ